MLLQGKTAIVTGSNRGIGKAILETFAKNGAFVFAHARRETEEFLAFIKELEETYSVTIVPIYFDAKKEEEISKAVKEIVAFKKDIDILVNNLGVVESVSLFQMTPIQAIRDEFEVNFFSQLLFTQYISRLMVRKKKGSIINISSVAGIEGTTGMLSYVAGKGAMISATKRLAIELGSYNIRVNTVAPGLTDTDMGGMMNEQLEAETLNRLIFKRKAKPEEIANGVLFFASDLSEFVTGQVLRVDGGMMS
jgi:3-oxoacyl-[acyl-carrier protein] reductase